MKCGKCCHTFELNLKESESTNPAREAIVREFKARQIILKEITAIKFKIQGTCIHLCDDKTCDDYENRPQLCRDYYCANCLKRNI